MARLWEKYLAKYNYLENSLLCLMNLKKKKIFKFKTENLSKISILNDLKTNKIIAAY